MRALHGMKPVAGGISGWDPYLSYSLNSLKGGDTGVI